MSAYCYMIEMSFFLSAGGGLAGQQTTNVLVRLSRSVQRTMCMALCTLLLCVCVCDPCVAILFPGTSLYNCWAGYLYMLGAPPAGATLW